MVLLQFGNTHSKWDMAQPVHGIFRFPTLFEHQKSILWRIKGRTDIILPPITNPPHFDNPQGALKKPCRPANANRLSLRARPEAMYLRSKPLLNGWRKCQAIFPSSSGTPHPPPSISPIRSPVSTSAAPDYQGRHLSRAINIGR